MKRDKESMARIRFINYVRIDKELQNRINKFFSEYDLSFYKMQVFNTKCFYIGRYNIRINGAIYEQIGKVYYRKRKYYDYLSKFYNYTMHELEVRDRFNNVNEYDTFNTEVRHIYFKCQKTRNNKKGGC